MESRTWKKVSADGDAIVVVAKPPDYYERYRERGAERRGRVPSRTRRLVSNIRAAARDGGRVEVAANFAVFRVRNAIMDTYVGHYSHVLNRSEAGGFTFVTRKAMLDLDALRPHGKVSIIL